MRSRNFLTLMLNIIAMLCAGAMVGHAQQSNATNFNQQYETPLSTTRLALVIGNSNYLVLPKLANPAAVHGSSAPAVGFLPGDIITRGDELPVTGRTPIQ
jgi:hypothetical protein